MFRLYIDIGQTGTQDEVDITDAFARTHELTSLTTGQYVDVQITSINASGESVKSDVLTLQAASHPDAPATPTETAITQEEYSDSTLKIQVSWVEPANNGAAITGYQLWMSKQSLDFEMVYDGASRSDVLTYLVENQILRSTSYNFKVRAINRIGYSSFSPVLKSFAAVVPSTPLGFHHTAGPHLVLPPV